MKLVTFNEEGRAISVFSVWPDDYEAYLDRSGIAFNIVPEESDPRSMMYSREAHPVPRPDCNVMPVVSGRVVTVEGAAAWFVTMEGLMPIQVADSSVEIDPGPVSIRIVPEWPYKEAIYDLTIE